MKFCIVRKLEHKYKAATRHLLMLIYFHIFHLFLLWSFLVQYIKWWSNCQYLVGSFIIIIIFFQFKQSSKCKGSFYGQFFLRTFSMNFSDNPASIYLLKVNHRNDRTKCKACSKLTIKTPELRQCRCSGFFFVNLNIFYILSYCLYY